MTGVKPQQRHGSANLILHSLELVKKFGISQETYKINSRKHTLMLYMLMLYPARSFLKFVKITEGLKEKANKQTETSRCFHFLSFGEIVMVTSRLERVLKITKIILLLDKWEPWLMKCLFNREGQITWVNHAYLSSS